MPTGFVGKLIIFTFNDHVYDGDLGIFYYRGGALDRVSCFLIDQLE